MRSSESSSRPGGSSNTKVDEVLREEQAGASAIAAMGEALAKHQIVSDNGSQFISKDFMNRPGLSGDSVN